MADNALKALVASWLNKIPYALLFVFFLIYQGFDFYTYLNSNDSVLLQKRNEVKTTQEETLRMQTKLRQAEEFFRTLEAKKAALREVARRLEEMKATITEDTDVASFIKTIVTEAKKVGITVSGIKPKAQKQYDYYYENSFELTFSGVFVQLVVFLDRLSSVQKIIRIDNMSVRLGSGQGNSRFSDLTGTLELKAYHYHASKADELGKAVISGLEMKDVKSSKDQPKEKK